MIDRRPLGNILVATDFSSGAKRALDRACRLPITRGCTLTLLHVVPELHASLFARVERPARAEIARRVEEARTQVGPDIDVVGAVEVGKPFEQIGRRADGDRAELIVLGRHGRRAWPRESLGGTTDRVLRRGATAVLVVVDRPTAPYRKLMVAVDEEGSATAAIELAARIAPAARGALAVHVVETEPLILPPEYGISAEEVEQHGGAQREATRRRIELALDQLGGTELDFDLRFVEGDPRSAILETALVEQADLVAVGTRGRSGLHHLFLGSVAEAVIRRADVDVLVARAR